MMNDAQLFTTAALQSGYRADAAEAALAWARVRLSEGETPLGRMYIFRSASHGGGEGPARTPPARPRVLLAFRSADAALSFAQASKLGSAPRLAAMSLGQLLTALIQRPSIGVLLVASESDGALQEGLPVGPRIERAALLDQLQIADCRL
ncbi:hypothetical protein K2Z83_14650 [Oscillochloris sp. ZM17-4]|uniref:hypothetical protein n=1 Tax=Oscillochloris sp. ZM17-4 TaxID=2866714 RepID=UPI001C73A905|nr:hypothetical protein [Oscillochloris sp. ZM17-4]MBX0328916.1 hypothetical protein [Oscillochloris sp. ZM17-4]